MRGLIYAPMHEESRNSDSPIITENEDSFQVRLKYPYPEPLQAVYANQLVIQHSPQEFLISFYQAFPPCGLEAEDIREQIKKEGGMTAQCVARVAVPHSKMEAIVEAFVTNLQKYKSRIHSTQETTESE